MSPLIVLITAFVISTLGFKILKGRFQINSSGRIALSVMMLFTAIAHFAFTEGMEMMLPSFIPYKTQVVYLTGIIEVAAAIGILIPSLRLITGILLISFLLLIIPANIYAAVKQVDYQNATYDGNGLNYLWFRLPLQAVFIMWTYFFAVKYKE